MFRFTIRDVLWLTAVASVGLGWWLDRSKLTWQGEQAQATIGRLRERLDQAQPEWRARGEHTQPNVFDRKLQPEAGIVAGAILFGVAVLIVVFVWQGRIHRSILDRKRIL